MEVHARLVGGLQHRNSRRLPFSVEAVEGTDPGLQRQHLTEGLGASATHLAGADRLLSRAPEPVDPARPGPALPNLTSG